MDGSRLTPDAICSGLRMIQAGCERQGEDFDIVFAEGEYGKGQHRIEVSFCRLLSEAVELLKEKEAKWIPVSERLPEEEETIFAKLKGTDKWHSAMFEKMSDDVRVVVVFADGTRRVSHSYTVDGKWECEKSPLKRTVTHWMQNPELPKDGDGK